MFGLGDQGEPSSNKKIDIDANKTSDVFFPTVKAVFNWVSDLFVKGAASSTDNAIARFDGTSGKLLEDSSVIISDQGYLGIVTPGSGLTPQRTLHVATATPTWLLTRTGNSVDIKNRYVGVDVAGAMTFGKFPDSYVGATVHALLTSEGDLLIPIGSICVGVTTPTAKLDLNGTSRFRGNATFNGQIIDNAGSSGTDGQVLKKVGGLVLWSNP